MWKFISAAWTVWGIVRPIYSDLMRIIKEVKEKGLTDDAARKQVIQDTTDFIQAMGLKSIPDSVLNTAIELVYQIYLWDHKK